MFPFNKDTSMPQSRQSSIESTVTDPSTVTSTSACASEAWVSQSSNNSSYGELPSPNQWERSQPGKRSSVFKLRSRSNTATSTSSYISLTPTMTRSRPASQDLRHVFGQDISDAASGKKSIFARQKKGKRSSVNLSPRYEDAEPLEDDSRTSVLRRIRRSANPTMDPVHPLKNRISSPFDFKHLTHTDRHQFPALAEADENELAAEFRAVRASQAPCRDLTGIKADDLHFQNFSSEDLASPRGSAPSSATSQQWQSEQDKPTSSEETSNGRQIRPSRSVESFSQPGINPRTHRHTQSAQHPVRSSSRLALAPIHDSDDDSAPRRSEVDSNNTSRRNSGIWDLMTPLSPSTTPGSLPTIADEESYFGEAVTTPDNTAIHPTTPSFSPHLEDVAEESDRFVSPRPAPTPPIRSPKTPRSPALETRGIRRATLSRTASRSSSFTSSKSGMPKNAIMRPMSQMSDPPGFPVPMRRSSIRKASAARRKSNTWRVIEDSWEDDIDYIYDNALEADCDFDWDDRELQADRDRTSEQQDQQPRRRIEHSRQDSQVMSSEEDVSIMPRTFGPAFPPSLLVPSPSHVPELESHSAVSTATFASSIGTPSDFCSPSHQGHVNMAGAGNFDISPPLFVPDDFKEQVLQEIYDDILADYECGDQHFPLLDARGSVSDSIRSSNLRSSKRSSYDSSLTSSRQGSIMWGSPIHRSASSSGSLPELVHSRRSYKDSDMMVEGLGLQTASVASTLAEAKEPEDHESTTPPARQLQCHDVPTKEGKVYDQTVRATIEGEVKASLELARQGSTRSKRTPAVSHKHASSEDSAKMLSAAMRNASLADDEAYAKRHVRAASSSSAFRGR